MMLSFRTMKQITLDKAICMPKMGDNLRNRPQILSFIIRNNGNSQHAPCSIEDQRLLVEGKNYGEREDIDLGYYES